MHDFHWCSPHMAREQYRQKHLVMRLSFDGENAQIFLFPSSGLSPVLSKGFTLRIVPIIAFSDRLIVGTFRRLCRHDSIISSLRFLAVLVYYGSIAHTRLLGSCSASYRRYIEATSGFFCLRTCCYTFGQKHQLLLLLSCRTL